MRIVVTPSCPVCGSKKTGYFVAGNDPELKEKCFLRGERIRLRSVPNGKNCFCNFCGLKNIRKELLSQILWIRTPNDKQNVMETFSDKMLGSIGKKLMSKVTHFLIFKV